VASLKVLLNGLPSDEAAEYLALYLSSNPSVAQALLSLMQGNSTDAQGATNTTEITAMGWEGVAGPSTQSCGSREEAIHSSAGTASSRTPQRSASSSSAGLSPIEVRGGKRVVGLPIGSSAPRRRTGGTVDTALQQWGREAVGHGAANNAASRSVGTVEYTMKPRELEAQQQPKPKAAQTDAADQNDETYIMGANTMYRAQHMLCKLGDLGKAATPAKPAPSQLRVRRSLALQPKGHGRSITQSMPVL